MAQAQKNKNCIEDLVPIHELRDELIILEDGAVSIGFKLNLFPDEGVDESTYKSYIDILSKTIRKFPLGTVLQQIDSYYPKSFGVEESYEFFNFFHQKQLEHYKGHSFLSHNTYLFVTCIAFTDVIDPHLTIFSSGGKGFSNPFKKLEETIHKVRKCATELAASFPEEWDCKQLNESENLSLCYAWLNLDFSKPIDGLENGITNGKGFFKVGNKQCSIISMQSQSGEPKYCGKNGLGFSGGVTVPFTWNLSHYLNFPHITIQALQVQNTEAFLKGRTKEFEWSQGTKRSDRALRNANQDMDALISFEESIREQEEIIVGLNYLVLVYDVDTKRLDNHVEEVKKEFKRLDMTPFLEDYDTANLYFSAMPGNGAQLYRGQPMALKTALAYFNACTPRLGSKDGILLANRQEIPIYYDPFNLTLDNQNAFIFGPSGSGKSFFNGKMIKDRFQAGHIVVVIDSGGTYRRLFQVLGGKYIEYNPETPLHLNPFLIKPNASGIFKPDINKVTFLVQLIGKIWKGDLNKNPMSEVEQALLSKWIASYYTTFNKESVPSLTKFYDYLEEMVENGNSEEIKKLIGEGLFPFHDFFIVLEPFAHGIYKKHFNSYKQDHLGDHKLICFELEAIRNNPKLYPIVVQVLFEFVFEMVASNPDATKFIDIEEGWTMLNDYSEENIAAFFRKGRKTKTSIRIITQNIDEIKSSRIAGAMKNNASTFILLYNDKKSSREEIGEFLGMSQFDMEKYESLRRKNGRDGYREVFIKEMSDAQIYLLHTSLWEHALLTSRPDERNRITNLIKEKGDNLLGISSWVTEQIQLNSN
jgi:GTPase SAR1 family protein